MQYDGRPVFAAPLFVFVDTGVSIRIVMPIRCRGIIVRSKSCQLWFSFGTALTIPQTKNTNSTDNIGEASDAGVNIVV